MNDFHMLRDYLNPLYKVFIHFSTRVFWHYLHAVNKKQTEEVNKNNCVACTTHID